MTVFWLLQLHYAAVRYQSDRSLDAFPTKDDFKDIVVHTPSLMNRRLWAKYYSKDLLFSPAARENWNLPDLCPLPSSSRGPVTSQSAPLASTLDSDDSGRLMQYSFEVVKSTIMLGARRGAMVKQALASLQISTLQSRAQGISVAPYSETQTYFWIQIVHAALRSLDLGPGQGFITVPLSRLDFSSFKLLFGFVGSEWQQHYTPKLWNDISSRMQFVPPDLEPLPSVINGPTENMAAAQRSVIQSAALSVVEARHLPSPEVIAFVADLLIEDVLLLPEPITSQVTSHAHLILYLYTQLVAVPDVSGGGSLATQATNTLLALVLGERDSHTDKSFWIHQILAAVASTRSTKPITNGSRILLPPSFKEFIRAHPQLAYEGLPFTYYSPELWNSAEAREMFIPPDRKTLPSFVPMTPLADVAA